jgi:hypothetical protein
MNYKKLTLLAFLMLLGIAFGRSLVTKANATACVVGQTQPPLTGNSQVAQEDGWASGQTINVQINTGGSSGFGFSQSDAACINSAFLNWNAARVTGAASTNVYFSVTYTSNPAVTENNGNTSGPAGYYSVNKVVQSPGNWGTTSRGVGNNQGAASRRNAVTGLDVSLSGNCTGLTEIAAHEIGHTFGLGDCGTCVSMSTLMVASWNGVSSRPSAPTSCDKMATSEEDQYGDNDPTPPCDPCCAAPTTSGSPVPQNKCCPILIDTNGKGFHLTAANNGVRFDILGNGQPIHISWTDEGGSNAWLALDRNGDGKIDSGKELFGNFTEQPASAIPNGFNALAVYDMPENGGNGDGVIDSRDFIYHRLLLWIDKNHNGVSEPDELFTLPQLGVETISLKYQTVVRVDKYGNLFRYKAMVNPGDHDSDDPDIGQWGWDVFLVKAIPQ